jgi:nitrate reductase gamma subunit
MVQKLAGILISASYSTDDSCPMGYVYRRDLIPSLGLANNMDRNKKKTVGTTQFWVGIVFLIIGIILGAITSSSGNGDLDLALALITGWGAVIAFGISCLFLLIGVILFFKGRSQVKKQKAG